MSGPGLRRKFLLAFVGLAALFAAVFGVLAASRLRAALGEQVRLRAKVVAEELAREASSFLRTPEGLTPGPTSSRLTRRLVAGTVLYAQIYRDGRLQFTDGRADLAVAVPPLDRPMAIYMRRSPSGTPYLDLLRAVPEFPLERQVFVRVGFPLSDVARAIRRETRMIALAGALLLAAGTLAAVGLSRAILGPVERLAAGIRDVRRGNYAARVQATTRDELQLLAEEFNAMAAAIEARDRELARVNEALRRANRIKDEFSAAMSHELKTPLHAIRAYAQLMLEGIDGPLTDAQRRDLEAIHAAGDHLLHLIEAILRYSALEAGGITPQLADVPAAGVVEQACQNVAHLARAKGLGIETRIDGTVTARADETMLRQILINLLHNAIKYTARGSITVGVAPADGQVVFSVADTGPGIAPEDAATVFEPFRRAGDAARREVDGIGLGLAVVRRYVELLDGRIWFESGPQGGTTFYVALPRGRTA
ncbi:MAG: HAMP domain-containing sensor histidine kinase [Armatimonadota bacterium]|nr:HAMP domain-containing sensor histidine kinase [Armatimonadota bacterium]